MSHTEAPPVAAATPRKAIRWRWLMASLALVLLGGVELVQWAQPPEPTYQGKRVSQWFDEFGSTRISNTEDPALQALTAMGDSSVPFLLRQLALQPSRLQDQISAWMRKLPWPRWRWTTRAERNLKSFAVLMLMGPKAKAAIPELIRAAENKQIPYRPYAVRLLGYIHSEPERVVPVLTGLLRERGPDGALAALSLASFGRQAVAAAPELREWLQASNDEQSRAAAVVALLAMEESLDLAIPAARDLMASTNQHTRQFLVASLGELGVKPGAAAPILVEALQNTDPFVRQLAAHMLKRLDPNAAAKAGVK